jgi:hypothetical protein
MKKNLIATLTSLLLLGSLGLTACSTPDAHAPKVMSDTAVASASATPTATPTPTEEVIVPPAVKGPAVDAKGKYEQTSFDSGDSSWGLPSGVQIPKEVSSAYSQDEILAAYRAGTTFIAEEGIDSILRASGNVDDDAQLAAWVAANKSKFVEGTQFLRQGKSGEGYNFVAADNLWTDTKAPYTYEYNGSPRITERHIALREISAGGGDIKFDLRIRASGPVLENGAKRTVENSQDFVIVMRNVNGEWKIVKETMQSYGLGNYLEANGTKTPVKPV